MQLKHTLPLTVLSLLMGTALGQSCYDKGQQWKDVGVETVLDEAFRRVCATTNLVGQYRRHQVIRTCENVAGHSFFVSINHIDNIGGGDYWFLSPGTCFELLKKVYNACPDRGGSMILTAGGDEGNPWVNADVRVDPENSCCDC